MGTRVKRPTVNQRIKQLKRQKATSGGRALALPPGVRKKTLSGLARNAAASNASRRARRRKRYGEIMAGLGPGGRVKKKKKARRPRIPPGFVPKNPGAFARGDFSGGIRPIKGGPAARVTVRQAAETARKRAQARGVRTQVRKKAGAALPAAEIAILRRTLGSAGLSPTELAKEVRRQAQRRAGRVAGRLKGPRFE